MSPFITAIVGDITPSDGVPKAEKSRLEKEALDEMCCILGGGLRGNFTKVCISLCFYFILRNFLFGKIVNVSYFLQLGQS